MPITAILFDFDDTLVVEEASAEEAFLAACELAREKYDVEVSALHESVRRNARRIWQAAPTIDYCRAIGISSWEGLWAGFLGDDPNLAALRKWAPEYRREAWSAALEEHGIDDVSLAERLAEAFRQERRRRHIVFPDAENVLQELRREYRLGLITNGAPDLQREKIEGSGLAHYFDSITISGDVGVGKPDPKIFGAALDALGVEPEATAMVGNSLERDVAAAQAVGLKAIWLNRAGAACRDDVRPDAEITNLSELPALIEKLQKDGIIEDTRFRSSRSPKMPALSHFLEKIRLTLERSKSRLLVSEKTRLTLERIKRWLLRGSIRKRLLKSAALALLVLGVILSGYCLYLSIKIDQRFSGRRWRIPSKVFSDTTILYPGQPINRTLFHEKLKRLGYREVPGKPERKGEMKRSGSTVEIFLRDLERPSDKREGFPARIRFWKSEIRSIVNLNNGKSVHILEFEPEEIALLFGPKRERRQLVSIDQVPQHLINAVLSIEDKRFYDHPGIDPIGIMRAFFANMRRGAIVQGGSTITQQLAKCYFLYPKRTYTRKAKEVLMSLIMELKYEKDEILEIYLNEIYLGQQGSVSINGVGEASSFYFGKDVKDISLAEAATVGALIRAPNRYSPYVDEERCRDRRNTVLDAMYESGWISVDELHSAFTSPVTTAGAADFEKKAPYFVDYLTEQLASLYSPEDMASLGLSVFTTLDTQVQMAAERALERGLARLERANPELNRPESDKKMQGAVIVIQPKTGYILAMVGGRDYGVTQFNRAAHARRQPGSAFKPFVYLSGLEEYTPASRLSNKPISYELDGKLWEPQNFAPIREDYLTARDALARSVNLATVDLAMRIGLDRVVDTATSFDFSTPIKPYPSLSLGAFEVIPIEFARAYCAFAADGVLPYPLSLKEVVDDKGKALERRHMTIEHVISPAKAFVMTSMLRSVVTDGTARSLRKMGISFPVAGKTGTTNDYRDAWFVGYTPRILALVWIGFDYQSPIQATGATAALPVWADLMKSIPQYTSGDWFRMPPGVVKRVVCLESGEIALRNCPKSRKEIFLKENVPTQNCSLHRSNGIIRRIRENGEDLINNS